ncbi:MAG: hypothetical protein O3A63_04125 [Proteobacteria bacterium]|nr:hypothetical protein [Pseudomonadota bacterium]
MAQVDCSNIEDPNERLACFDQKFPTPATEAEAEQQIRADETRPTATEDVLAPASVGSSSSAAEAQSKSPFKRPSMFEDVKVDLSSTIKAIRAGDKQKMIFLLGNDQIWIQSKPRELPFSVGDEVTIRNGFIGGYFLRSANKVSTRVARIQ